MMQFYAVKRALPGLPAGRVERFADFKAMGFVRDGFIEHFDAAKHAEMPGAVHALKGAAAPASTGGTRKPLR